MKKLSLLLYLIILLVIVPFFHVEADMGPKSSIEVSIIGVENHYVIDLLYPEILPSQSDIDERKINLDNEWILGGQTIPDLLWTISDNGFISASLYRSRPMMLNELESNLFLYPYSPPQTIKVIIIFDDMHYLISDQITTKLFTSQIVWDLTDSDTSITSNQVGKIQEVFPVGLMTKDLLLRIAGTIVIEMVVLFAFFYRQFKSYKLALIVNTITQIILTGFMFGMRYFWSPFFGEVFVLIVGETIIIILEIIIYSKYLTEHSKNRAIGYTFVANFVSAIASFLILASLLVA